MPKVICTLPNASDEISGVKFSKHPDREGAMVSENISEDQAAHFLSIAGYEPVGEKKPTATAKSDAEREAEAERERQAAEAAAELEALRAKAKELGVECKGNWKADRLRAEIEKAEKVEKDKAGATESQTGSGDATEQK